MNITLTQSVRIAGVEQAAGTKLTVSDDLGADLIKRKAATNDNPTFEPEPVMATKTVTGRLRFSAGGNQYGAITTALSNAFRNAKGNNPRVNAALTAASVAFGGTPTAGQVGYATSGINTTGWTAYDIKTGAGAVLPFRAKGGFPHYGGTAVQGSSYLSTGGARRSATWSLSFVTNAPEPVIAGVGWNSTYRINVDGRRVGNIAAAASGGYQDLAINLRGLGAGFHEIEILLQQDDVVAGLKIPKSASVFMPDQKPLIAMFTDSLGNTAPDSTAVDCYSQVLGDYLGAEVWLFAYGGSGYETAAGGETFAARIALADAVLPRLPDLVIFAGGVNDADTATFQQSVATTLALAKTTFEAPVVALGSWAGGATNSQTEKAALELKIKAAAQASSVPFVPVMTDSTGAWITGTGNTASPAGNGTADVLFGNTDSTHWIGAGHAIMGRRVAYAVADVLGL